jgi:hypothetical protein
MKKRESIISRKSEPTVINANEVSETGFSNDSLQSVVDTMNVIEPMKDVNPLITLYCLPVRVSGIFASQITKKTSMMSKKNCSTFNRVRYNDMIDRQ